MVLAMIAIFDIMVLVMIVIFSIMVLCEKRSIAVSSIFFRARRSGACNMQHATCDMRLAK